MPGRAAIYARYSTTMQSDRSIEDQVELCRQYLRREGYREVAVFEDRARTSETLIGRVGLAKLLEAANEAMFDAVIVECVDRISRDSADLHVVSKQLRFHEIDIVSANEGLQNEIDIGVRGLSGTIFLKDLRDKIHRGMSGNIKEGLSAGGKSYGYATVLGKPGELEIDESEAETIREIFRSYADGSSPRDIVHRLNKAGTLPPRGMRWNASTLNGNAERGYGILRNRIYAGVLVWDRVRMVRHPKSGKRISRTKPRDKWKYAEVPHLRIVDEDLWDAVQTRLDQQSRERSAGRSTRKPARPFSGLLKCGCCGGGMAIHDRCGNAIRIRCSTSTESGSCDNNSRFRLDEIEAAIFAELHDHLMHPTYIEEYIRTFDAERRTLQNSSRSDRPKLERAIAEASVLFERRLSLFERGIIEGAEGEAKLFEAKSALGAAEAKLRELEAGDVELKLEQGNPARYAAAIRDLMDDMASPVAKPASKPRDLVRNLVSEIIVSPAQEDGIPIEVKGRISALVSVPQSNVGVAMVAEEGFEPPTPGL
jgi:site-specific DNA recombinase